KFRSCSASLEVRARTGVEFMRHDPHRRVMTMRAAFVVALTALVLVPSFVRSQDLAAAISDREFWRIVTEFSEPGGRFQLQYMSNEYSLQYVIPSLKEGIRPGGVYVGVGTEQNFTYIAALQPKLAFIIDIRRDNMLEHLMYKALFELSSD